MRRNNDKSHQRYAGLKGEIRTWIISNMQQHCYALARDFSIHNVRRETVKTCYRKTYVQKIQRDVNYGGNYAHDLVWTVRRHSNLLLAKECKYGELRRLTPSVTH